MMRNITDVVYAGFSSLAYADFRGIPSMTDVYEACFDMKQMECDDLRVGSRTVYLAYTEDPKYMKPLWESSFNDWKIFYSNNDIGLINDLFKCNLNKSSGFYATAFINDITKKVIIAFRGTDDFRDVFTDIELAMSNKVNIQFLCTYWFIRHIEERLKFMFPDTEYEISLTGHSLGGALCQYGSAIFGYYGMTFNALGAGIFYNMETGDVDLLSLVLKRFKLSGINIREYYKHQISDIITQNDNPKEIYNKLIELIYKHEEFDKRSKGNNLIKDIENAMTACVLATGTVKAMNGFTNGFRNDMNGDPNKANVDNYVFPNDWTTNLQTRLGKIIDITRTREANELYPFENKIDDSKMRVILQTIKRFGFVRHSIGNFILFVNTYGNFSLGYVRDTFHANLLKSLFVSMVEKRSTTYRDVKKIGVCKYEIDDVSRINVENILRYHVFDRNVYPHKDSIIASIRRSLYEIPVIKNSVVYKAPYAVLGSYNNLILDKYDSMDQCVTVHIK